jgi:putative FmdB family regulatory protein
VPTYQYSCTECGHFFETFQNFSDDSLTVCPVCDGKLRKVFNAVGVVFKGSGFYRNDSRGPEKTGSGSTNGSSSSSDKPAEKSADKKSEPSTKAPEKSSGSTPSASTPT